TDVESASSRVAPGDVVSALSATGHRPPAAVIALPEVPLDVRRALLAAARPDALRVASFVSTELAEAAQGDWWSDVDLVGRNWDEACALSGSASLDPGDLPGMFRALRPGLHAIVTAGANGSWAWDGRALTHARHAARHVAGTAGAGDAHLA